VVEKEGIEEFRRPDMIHRLPLRGFEGFPEGFSMRGKGWAGEQSQHLEAKFSGVPGETVPGKVRPCVGKRGLRRHASVRG